VSEGAPTLLIVDDDAAFRGALGGAMERRGFVVSLASSGAEAVALAKTTVFEYALVDMRMAGMGGIETVQSLRAIDEGTRIVVLTGFGTIANAVDAMKAGAFDYLAKPVDAAACERALQGIRGAAQDGPLPSIERVEWEYLHRVMSECSGNLSEAARRLGMHRRSLQRKLGRNPPTR
jgi:two-component system response regulator RegA